MLLPKIAGQAAGAPERKTRGHKLSAMQELLLHWLVIKKMKVIYFCCSCKLSSYEVVILIKVLAFSSRR